MTFISNLGDGKALMRTLFGRRLLGGNIQNREQKHRSREAQGLCGEQSIEQFNGSTGKVKSMDIKAGSTG